jgi:hypothetical protein
MANRLKLTLRRSLGELMAKPVEELLKQRYQKFRRMGVFVDGGEPNHHLFFSEPSSPSQDREPASAPRQFQETASE